MNDELATQEEVEKKALLEKNEVEAIINRITELQKKAGYDGNYKKWIDRHRPPRLEDLVGYSKDR